jgi:prepilin-type N-terminal cleavage/methylation domain-containing protein
MSQQYKNEKVIIFLNYFFTKITKNKKISAQIYSNTKPKKDYGFTLIELLVVIAIIGILSSVILASLNTARVKARDARRISDMNQVQTALAFYYSDNNQYPTSDIDGCGSWDVGNQDLDFISGGLGTAMPDPPEDQVGTGNCSGYHYYKYPPGSYGCPVSKGSFYILAVKDMETSGNPHPDSPGFGCNIDYSGDPLSMVCIGGGAYFTSCRNWQREFDWVTGNFEK